MAVRNLYRRFSKWREARAGRRQKMAEIKRDFSNSHDPKKRISGINNAVTRMTMEGKLDQELVNGIYGMLSDKEANVRKAAETGWNFLREKGFQLPELGK